MNKYRVWFKDGSMVALFSYPPYLSLKMNCIIFSNQNVNTPYPIKSIEKIEEI